MKKFNYLFLLILLITLALGHQDFKEVLAVECPIKTTGLSRQTFNDLKQKDPNIINEVKALQTIFSKIPNIGWQSYYKISGNFGYITEATLRRFQKAYGLNDTGVIDQTTRDKLCEIWEYQNRQIRPQSITDGTSGTSSTQGGTTYTPQGGGGTSAKECVYNVWSRDPSYCGNKPYCCVKNHTYIYDNKKCPADECQSDSDYTGSYLNDPEFWDEFDKGILGTSQSKFKVCKPKKCTEAGCVPSFVGYVRKEKNCPPDYCSDDKQCSNDYKKCVYDDCILVIPKKRIYKCATVTKYLKKTENCPASVNCKTSIYGCDNYGTIKHTCIVKKCENKNTPEGKCKEEKVSTYEPCDKLKNECSTDADCKLVEKYKFDLDKCECIKDQANGTLTLSECELKKATAIQKQDGGCKNKQPSDDWLKNIDCSLQNYTGSQPKFECEQKLGCKWCPECVEPSAVQGDFGDRGNGQTAHSLYTGYPGGKCIKINEPCVGKLVKGKCGAQCDESFDVVNPVSCTTGSYWGNDWAWQNCGDPKTCEARCYYGKCRYTDKNFRDTCSSAKTQEQCSKLPSCTWVYECRNQQVDGPYRPTWYYTGPLQINTCTAWGIYMTDWDYKCVKGKCGAECDDDSDCPLGSRCSLFCKCTAKDSDCIGDSDLGDPFTYGECRNGSIKNPSDYIWKDRCDGPKTLIEATLVDKGNCQCGYQTIDCSKLLVNGICKDGKCISSTGGEKTYCGCKDFQKICATEKNGGGNIGEKIECRPGNETGCPSCSKSCWWYKCEKNEKGEYRCKQYYEEKVSKEKPCPQSDVSCSDKVVNKVCTPPVETKCSSYGTDFNCYPQSECDDQTIKNDVKECKNQNKVCCKKKITTPTEKCSDYPGYSCESSSDCETGTSKGPIDCPGGKVCCKKKTTTGEWCEGCSTVKPCTWVRWYDRSGGCNDDWYNQRQEFIKDSCGGCDSGYKCQNGNCVATSCSAFSGYSCSAENYCESNTSKGKLDCPSGQVCCKPQTSGSLTKCEDANLKCVDPDRCQTKANQSMYYCLDSSKVCCIIEKTEKCSDYAGYSCVDSSRCKSGTSKGQLNCQSGECCKPIPDCSSFVGYSCNDSSQCQSGTIKSSNDAYCDFGVCCKPKGQTGI